MPGDIKIKCTHCDGTGVCRGGGKISCGFCLSAAKSKLGGRPLELKIVGCGYCDGMGSRFPDKENWLKQTMDTLNRPIEEGLTGYQVKKGEETRRILDKRRFIITIIAIAAGLVIILIGVYVNNLEILLPVASAVLTGALGYYIGGQTAMQKKVK